ncbi:hypothetical protein ACKKBG_A08830 [Auxenochlorella protothecoides x Auxenochlorella symbiontica]
MSPNEDILDDIHRSCTELLESCNDVWIDDAALSSAVDEGAEEARRQKPSLRLPLKFDDLTQEVNYIAVSHLLDQGSSHDAGLLASTGRTSRECMEYGLMACHLDGRSLDARFLAHFSRQQVFTYFNVDACVEEEVRPGIMLSKAGPLNVWVNNVVTVLQAAGKAMLSADHPSLGAWLLTLVDTAARDSPGEPMQAGALVGELARAVPGFRDEWAGLAEGSVCSARFQRKAQALVAALAARFGAGDPRFAFRGSDGLALDSGPDTIAALLAAGVLRAGAPLADALKERRDLGGSRWEAALRAGALEAGRRARALAAGSDGPVPSAARVLAKVLREQGAAEEGGRLIAAESVAY